MGAMGVAQAPIFPGQSVMKRDFQGGLPKTLRPWAIQFMRLSAAAGEIFSKVTTPIISVRYVRAPTQPRAALTTATSFAVRVTPASRAGCAQGWQAVCYAYGGVSLAFAVFWGILARSKPATPAAKPSVDFRKPSTAVSSDKKAALSESTSAVDMDEQKLEYGVLKVPAAIAVMFAHASCNNLGYTLTQWAPVSAAAREHSSRWAALSHTGGAVCCRPTTPRCSAATR